MTKRNLCDTCLHCAYYERLLEIGYTQSVLTLKKSHG